MGDGAGGSDLAVAAVLGISTVVAGLFVVEEIDGVGGGVGVGEGDGRDNDFGNGVLFVGVCKEGEDGEAVR